MKEKNKNFITYIFDFDQTIYDASKHGSYLQILYNHIFERINLKKEYIKFLTKNKKQPFPNIVLDVIKKIHQKFTIKIEQKDINFTINKLKKQLTPGLDEVIKALIYKGNKVMIIGGGPWGGVIIPELVKPWGIKNNNIYTGPFIDFSEKEVKNVLINPPRYANCANPARFTPYTDKKSELIKFLKKEGKITGKTIHIGDGLNDLEVWKEKAVDFFIGFGINIQNEEVKKNAPVFITDIISLKNELGLVK